MPLPFENFEEEMEEEEEEGEVQPFCLLVEKALPFGARIMEWCPTMDLLAVVTVPNHLYIHRTGDKVWQRLLSVGEHTSPITSICWSPNGKSLAVGYENGNVSIFSIENGEWLFKHTSKHHPTSATELLKALNNDDNDDNDNKKKNKEKEKNKEEETKQEDSIFADVSSIVFDEDKADEENKKGEEEEEGEEEINEQSVVKMMWVEVPRELCSSPSSPVLFPDDQKEIGSFSSLQLRDFERVYAAGAGPLPPWTPPWMEEIGNDTPLTALFLFRLSGATEMLAYGKLSVLSLSSAQIRCLLDPEQQQQLQQPQKPQPQPQPQPQPPQQQQSQIQEKEEEEEEVEDMSMSMEMESGIGGKEESGLGGGSIFGGGGEESGVGEEEEEDMSLSMEMESGIGGGEESGLGGSSIFGGGGKESGVGEEKEEEEEEEEDMSMSMEMESGIGRGEESGLGGGSIFGGGRESGVGKESEVGEESGVGGEEGMGLWLEGGFVSEDLEFFDLLLAENDPENEENVYQKELSLSISDLLRAETGTFSQLCSRLTNLTTCMDGIGSVVDFLARFWKLVYGGYLNQYVKQLSKIIEEEGESTNPALELVKRMTIRPPSPIMDRFLQRELNLAGTNRLQKRVEAGLTTLHRVSLNILQPLLTRILVELSCLKGISCESSPFQRNSGEHPKLSNMCDSVIKSTLLVALKIEEMISVSCYFKNQFNNFFQWTSFEQKLMESQEEMSVKIPKEMIKEGVNFVKRYLEKDFVGSFFSSSLLAPISTLQMGTKGGKGLASPFVSSLLSSSSSLPPSSQEIEFEGKKRGDILQNILGRFTKFGTNVDRETISSSALQMSLIMEKLITTIKDNFHSLVSVKTRASYLSLPTKELRGSHIWRESKKRIQLRKNRWVQAKGEEEEEEEEEEGVAQEKNEDDTVYKAFMVQDPEFEDNLNTVCVNKITLKNKTRTEELCVFQADSLILDFCLYKDSLLLLKKVEEEEEEGSEEEGEEGEEEEKGRERVCVRLSVYPLESLHFGALKKKERILWDDSLPFWKYPPQIEEEKGRNFTFLMPPPQREILPGAGLSGSHYPCFRAGTGRGVCVIYGHQRRIIVLDLEDDDEEDEEEEEEEEEEE